MTCSRYGRERALSGGFSFSERLCRLRAQRATASSVAVCFVAPVRTPAMSEVWRKAVIADHFRSAEGTMTRSFSLSARASSPPYSSFCACASVRFSSKVLRAASASGSIVQVLKRPPQGVQHRQDRSRSCARPAGRAGLALPPPLERQESRSWLPLPEGARPEPPVQRSGGRPASRHGSLRDLSPAVPPWPSQALPSQRQDPPPWPPPHGTARPAPPVR